MAHKLGKRSKLTIKIAVPVFVVLLTIMIVATVVMNMFPTVMGGVFGHGTLHVDKDDSFDLTEMYYDYESKNTDESRANARAVTRRIAEEGITLLKNEGGALPLEKGTGVTLFGYKSIDIKMSGGEVASNVKGAVSFEVAMGYGQDSEGNSYEKFKVNPSTIELYKANRNAADELVTSSYAAIESTYKDYNSAAIVVFGRNSGEGNDQTIIMRGDNNRTGLSLSSNELALLEYVCQRAEFDKVIVIIGSSNAMELGFLRDNGKYTDKYTNKTYDFSKIKAGLWVGGVGSTGALALADILDGTVSPSGKLPDTYVRDITADPSFKNFGSFAYTNYDASKDNKYYSTNTSKAYFVEYEEGIYVGYRYYETAAKEALDGNYEGFNYDRAVTYPFGYGLSYSNFSYEYEGTPVYNDKEQQYVFNVKVTNAKAENGGVKAKRTVMIFCNQPYASGQVEKSHVVLAGFAKTKMLAPGESDTVTIKVDRDLLCSYDYKNEKCYMLDAGAYKFYLSDNAHSWAEIDGMDAAESSKYLWTHTLSNKIVFNESNKRSSDKTPAVNRFDEDTNWKFKDEVQSGSGFATNFSRTNFKKTFPSEPAGKDFEMEPSTKKQFEKYKNGKYSESNQTAVVEKDAGTLQLVNMRGLDYDDPTWQTYLEQFTAESLYNMFARGGWQTTEDETNGVPKGTDCDGVIGFFGVNSGYANDTTRNTWYTSGPIVAATFNVDLANEMGDAVAEEAHQLGITGWYAPGANTHRSALGGRNYEYYSEDPLLSGTMLAKVCTAAAQKGLITYAKHASLNDQETNRQANGLVTWCNEQAMREVYFKPWEIYIKTSKITVKYFAKENNKWVVKTKEMPGANAMMTAYNRVGAIPACHSTAMVNEIYRGECGFTGISLTDCGGGAGNPAGSGDYMNPNDCLYTRATDLMLVSGSTTINEPNSNAAIIALQDAAHRILYNKANSAALQQVQMVDGQKSVSVIYPGSTIWREIAPWRVLLISLWVVVGIIVAAGIALIVTFVVLDTKKNESRLTN